LSGRRRDHPKLGQQPGSALLVTPDPYLVVHRSAVVPAAGQYRVPATYSYRQHVQEGGLMSYGADTGTYSSARLLHRSHPERISPADLPAQAPVKFAIAINLKTAKALGLDIPPNPRGLADEVI